MKCYIVGTEKEISPHPCARDVMSFRSSPRRGGVCNALSAFTSSPLSSPLSPRVFAFCGSHFVQTTLIHIQNRRISSKLSPKPGPHSKWAHVPPDLQAFPRQHLPLDVHLIDEFSPVRLRAKPVSPSEVNQIADISASIKSPLALASVRHQCREPR